MSFNLNFNEFRPKSNMIKITLFTGSIDNYNQNIQLETPGEIKITSPKPLTFKIL